MIHLIIVSLIWAFSFGLIKGNLTGLDSNFVSFARILISLLVFLPFLRLHGVNRRLALRLMITGALQFGVMYIAYIFSFQFLKAYEVALFTIFTPIYITLLNDGFRKKFNSFHLLMAFLAVIGTGVIVFKSLTRSDLLLGFLVVQISNICFAVGQIYYREVMRQKPQVKDYQIFGLLYLGAVLITGLAASFTTNWASLSLTGSQIWTLLYLGVLASGICFFLWNYGARQVNGGTLAVINNLKVPLAVAVSVMVFGESANIPRLLIGGGIVLAALFFSEIRHRKKTAFAEDLV